MAQTGMFLDGVTYAAIARNLSEGIGTFWFPSYTSTLLPVFHDDPPLAFGLQGVASAIIGDHVAVERVYSILMGALVALLMVLIWRSTVRDSAYDWLPVVFWLLPEGATWSVANNMPWSISTGCAGDFRARHAASHGSSAAERCRHVWCAGDWSGPRHLATWPPSCAVELLGSTSRRVRNWRQRAVGWPVDLVGATSCWRGHRADGCASCVALALAIGPKVSRQKSAQRLELVLH